jgi:hypothetical protein
MNKIIKTEVDSGSVKVTLENGVTVILASNEGYLHVSLSGQQPSSTLTIKDQFANCLNICYTVQWDEADVHQLAQEARQHFRTVEAFATRMGLSYEFGDSWREVVAAAFRKGKTKQQIQQLINS